MPLLLTKFELDEAVARLCREIAAVAPTDIPIAIVGIRRRGEILAKRMLPLLRERRIAPLHYGALDITLYRDDLTTIGPAAVHKGTEIDFDVAGAWIVLVDDVLYTGRSVRAAMDALIDRGRPAAIRLAVVVDRGWREFPIQADFAGLRTVTQAYHIVKVKLAEIDGADEVELYDNRGG